MASTRPGFGILNRNVILGRQRGRPLSLEDVYRLMLDLGDQLDCIERKLNMQATQHQAGQDSTGSERAR